jgi:hypothetical protein
VVQRCPLRQCKRKGLQVQQMQQGLMDVEPSSRGHSPCLQTPTHLLAAKEAKVTVAGQAQAQVYVQAQWSRRDKNGPPGNVGPD